MASIDYGENLAQAVEIIVKSQLEGLAYDKTLLCSIVDNSQAKEGVYRVSDGSVEFTAYSTDKNFNVGANVYVQIPQGDFNQQKTIIGKKVSAESESVTWISPLNNFVDITGNILPEQGITVTKADQYKYNYVNSKEIGLIANYNRHTKAVSASQEIMLYEYVVPEQYKSKYDRIGFSAEFRTMLSGVKSGSYGLRVLILEDRKSTSGDMPANAADSKQKEKVTYFAHEMDLDVSDMWGDPYNFVTPYRQEIVFDISAIESIHTVKIFFYQKGNFKDTKDNVYPVISTTQENLWVKNIRMSLGYAFENFDSDKVMLYTFDPLTYAETSTDIQNKKNVNLRWVHNDGERFSCIDTASEIEAVRKKEQWGQIIIHWYKHVLQNGVKDNLAGAFWQEMIEHKNKFAISYQPDIKLQYEKLKAIIECTRDAHPTEQDMKTFAKIVQHIYIIGTDSSKPEEFGKITGNGEEMAALLAEIDTLQKEIGTTQNHPKQATLNYKIGLRDSLIDLYNINRINMNIDKETVYYYSELLEFENEEFVIDDPSVDLIQGMKIVCDEDGSHGNYFIYGMDNGLQNPAEGYKVRELKVVYNELHSGVASLDTAESIIWYIPKFNTMIEKPAISDYVDGDEVPEDDQYYDSEYYCFRKTRYDVDDQTMPQVGETIENQDKMNFKIKSYYTQTAINNTVYCIVIKNKRVYQSEFTMHFGPQGTHGTDYTFVLSLGDEVGTGTTGVIESKVPAVTIDGLQRNLVEINAELFDFENKKVEDANVKVSYSWYCRDGSPSIDMCKDTTGTVFTSLTGNNAIPLGTPIYIRPINNPAINNCRYNILQADITVGTVKLTAFLPIAIRTNRKYIYAELPSTIVYDNQGKNPIFYKEPIRIREKVDDKTFNWIVPNCDVTFEETAVAASYEGSPTWSASNYYPKVKVDKNNDKSLQPANMYYQDLSKRVGLALGDVWRQPLLIIQNRYASAMLNSWDGKLTIDEKNGIILSSMIGAGKKNDDNSFSGVLMGNVQIADKTPTIGLYGYNYGAQSFGFLENGTAFIGKSNTGRIWFDGNQGYITSQSYKNGETGMIIDLNNGFIDMRGATSGATIDENGHYTRIDHTLTRSQVRIDVNSPYFMIKSNEAVNKPSTTLMYVGNEDYFLQSDTYSSVNKTGFHFNLMQGKMYGYNFLLKTAGNANQSEVILSSGLDNNPFLRIRDNNGDIILNISQSEYYLQSSAYNGGTFGTHLNLRDGYLVTYGADGGFVKLNGEGTPFFQIHNGSSNIFYCGNYDYYLQSAGYPSAGGVKIDFVVDSDSGNSLEGGTGETTWYIQKNGKATFNYIDAVMGGKIGPFYITSTHLCTEQVTTIGENGIYLGTEGFSVSSGKFTIDKFGNTSINGEATLTVESGIIQSGGTTKGKYYSFNQSGGHIGPWKIDEKAIWCGETFDAAVSKLGVDGSIKLTADNMVLEMNRSKFQVIAKDGNSELYPQLFINPYNANLLVTSSCGMKAWNTADNSIKRLTLLATANDYIEISNNGGFLVKTTSQDFKIIANGLETGINTSMIYADNTTVAIGQGLKSYQNRGLLVTQLSADLVYGNRAIGVTGGGEFVAWVTGINVNGSDGQSTSVDLLTSKNSYYTLTFTHGILTSVTGPHSTSFSVDWSEIFGAPDFSNSNSGTDSGSGTGKT